MVCLSYYALTTLSTIGYGDFLPKTANEKLTMGLTLLMGVTVFSLIMNKLMDVLRDYKEIEINIGQDPKSLAKWLGLLAKINNGMPLKKSLVEDIEEFFVYYWTTDRLRTLKSSNDVKILNELNDTYVH